ncbi:predicted protein [Coccidioides posadasii str. Silveira]|uniref:Predicted protein n=1 Tax=Coccidioides posadasii (strain RMSCC 757 / Silveira) TaxID=443226 RepID=E9DJ28_COCPS|nr:predicted protein [Coccidioides posadasii str. Silveira]
MANRIKENGSSRPEYIASETKPSISEQTKIDTSLSSEGLCRRGIGNAASLNLRTHDTSTDPPQAAKGGRNGTVSGRTSLQGCPQRSMDGPI